MSKKVLLSVAAVTLLAMTAFAGEYKYEDWPTATKTVPTTITHEVRTLIETIPVKIHIPYFVIVSPQNSEIMLKQVGQDGNERYHFRGIAIGKDGDNKKVKPAVTANFSAVLTTSLSVSDDGKALDTKNSVWTNGVDEAANQSNPRDTNPNPWPKATSTNLVPQVRKILDIWVDVTLLNLMAFEQCSTPTVGTVSLYIMHL
jgi:hypothetical protein